MQNLTKKRRRRRLISSPPVSSSTRENDDTLPQNLSGLTRNGILLEECMREYSAIVIQNYVRRSGMLNGGFVLL